MTERLTRDRKFWKGGILFSGVLGILCGLIGLLASFEALVGMTGSGLSRTGTLLIAAAFPLLLLAAHCMDKVRAADMAMRLEYCRQNGLRDEDS